MNKHLTKLRDATVSRRMYPVNYLRKLAKYVKIWPAGCRAITKYLDNCAPEIKDVSTDDIFAEHYDELFTNLMQLRKTSSHFAAIPADCVNAIISSMISVFDEMDDDDDFIQCDILLLGRLYSFQGRPSQILWERSNSYSMRWYNRDGCLRSCGPCHVAIGDTVYIAFTYDPHSRGELLNCKFCIPKPDNFYETAYVIECSRDEFAIIHGVAIPQTMNEAMHFRWP